MPHNSSSSTKELTLSDKAVSAKKISKSAKIKKRETKDVFLFAPPSNSNCGNMIHTISSSPQHIDAFQAVSGDEEVGSIATDAHTSRQDWSMFLNLPEGEEVLKVYHL